jgi:exodeoxyribonuclease-5
MDNFFDNELKKLEKNQLRLPSGKIITFNSQQSEALNRINKWLESDKSFFTLMGYAGTGKSTIVKKMLDSYYYGVVVSAPTHQAKKIIANTTGKEGKTLQSLLGLRADVEVSEYNPNSPIFNPIAPSRICDYNLVVLDEGSMVNKALFDLILSKVIGHRTKVLIMGDPAQLPPIGEQISPVFIHPDIETFELTVVERQSFGNPLMPVYDALRNNLTSLDGGINRISNINDNEEGILFTVDKSKFRELLFAKFKSEDFKNNSDYIKGLAWRNSTVTSSNKIIRDELFGSDVDIVEINDILRGYRTVSNEKLNYNIIENSADYCVTKKSNVETNVYGISGYRVTIREDLGNERYKYDNIFIINTTDHQNLHLYAKTHDFLRDTAKLNKKLWKKYYEFRRSNILMENIEHYENCLLSDVPAFL